MNPTLERAIVLLLSVAPMLSACGSSPAPTVSTALQHALEVRTRARLQALEAQRDEAESNGRWYIVRYNPPSCPCPPFEVRRYSQWQRVVFLDEEEGTAAADLFSLAFEFASEGYYPVYGVSARDTGQLTQGELAAYPTLQLTSSFPIGPLSIEEAQARLAEKNVKPWVPLETAIPESGVPKSAPRGTNEVDQDQE